MSGHGGHIDPSNKRVALVIAVLAAGLAFSETLGKSAQTAALNYNVEASNLWSFFQAKTIRMTAMRTASETPEVDLARESNARSKVAMEKRIAEQHADVPSSLIPQREPPSQQEIPMDKLKEHLP